MINTFQDGAPIPEQLLVYSYFFSKYLVMFAQKSDFVWSVHVESFSCSDLHKLLRYYLSFRYLLFITEVPG